MNSSIGRMLLWFGLIVFTPLVAKCDDNQIENPVYASWAPFQVGTKVRYKNQTTSENASETRFVEYQLIEKKADSLEVEISHFLSETSKNPDSQQSFRHRKYFQLPKGADKSKFGKPNNVLEESKEQFQFHDSVLNTSRTKSKVKVEAGDTFTTSWSCPEIPGGLFKSVSETPATKSVTKIELLSIDKP